MHCLGSTTMLKLALCYARKVGLQFNTLFFLVHSSGEEMAADRLASDCSDDIILAMDRELLGVTGVVNVILDTMQCGFLLVEQLDVPVVSVFFRASEVMLASGQEQGGKLSALLPKGTQVTLNGKLMKGDSKLPYLATKVWMKSWKVHITHKVSQDIKQDLLDSYSKVAQDLDKGSIGGGSDESEKGAEFENSKMASHKQFKHVEDHTYSLVIKGENTNLQIDKKKKYQKRKLGKFNSEKETVSYEINFEAKISKMSLNSWKCRQCNMEFTSLVKVNMHANRDTCEVVTRKTRPYKDTK